MADTDTRGESGDPQQPSAAYAKRRGPARNVSCRERVFRERSHTGHKYRNSGSIRGGADSTDTGVDTSAGYTATRIRYTRFLFTTRGSHTKGTRNVTADMFVR